MRNGGVGGFTTKGFKHGTHYAYQKKGCRCDVCVKEYSDYQKQRYRERKGWVDFDVLHHGTRSRYTRGGCRCDECRAANAAYAREARRKKREAREAMPESSIDFTYGGLLP